jgi:hypothetical protein
VALGAATLCCALLATTAIGAPQRHRSQSTSVAGRWTAAAGSAVAVPARPRRFPSAAAIKRAIAYLRSRDCDSAMAVVDTRGTLRGYRANVTFTSASVVKAMLLVQYLRSHSHLTTAERQTLSLMITQSDNDAAYRIFAVVGNSGLERLATLAGMRHFGVGGNVLYSRITAADQARFFYRLDELVPRARRSFARYLLSHIVTSQTWGVAQAARPRWHVFFKNGWFGAVEDPYTLVNQVARLERGKLVSATTTPIRRMPSRRCAA